MQIVKYEFTKKNKYNVYLSNGEVLNLQEQVITENELLLKKEISQELYNKLVRDNKIYELMEMAVKYISIRLRSIKEIKDYLLKKGGSNNEVEDAVQRLIESGYLDDDRFTKAFIKDKLKFTTIGDYKIKMQLNNLGVSSSIIEDNMDKIDNNIIEEKIKKIIEKDKKRNKKYTGQILKNKIYNHLLNQGYSQDKVIAIINTYDF
ncbi:MAG: regulatory protein RecX [Bacilli bacterium]